MWCLYTYTFYVVQRFIRRLLLCGWAWFLTPKHLERFVHLHFTVRLCNLYILQDNDVAVRARFRQWHPPAFLLKSTYISITKYKQNAIIYPHILTLLLRKFFLSQYTYLTYSQLGLGNLQYSFFPQHFLHLKKSRSHRDLNSDCWIQSPEC